MFNLPPLSSNPGQNGQSIDLNYQMRVMRSISAIIKGDQDAPEDLKVSLEIIDTQCDISDLIREQITRPLTAGGGATIEEKKEVLEYLLLVKSGIENFIQSRRPGDSK